MKTPIIICALTLSIALLKGQSENKSSTIRIKKIENINGVEKKVDTTRVYTGPPYHKSITGSESGENSNQIKKIIIITDEISGDEHDLKSQNMNEEAEEIMKKALEAGYVDANDMAVDKVFEINTNEKAIDGKCDKKMTRIIITKKIDISEPSDVELKMLGKESGITDIKLGLDEMNFYPNPNNGKFNLSFTLPEKKDTEVNIINAEGKNIYHENILNFSGKYDKEIDISTNPKGIYFVKIAQGKNAQTKKIVIE